VASLLLMLLGAGAVGLVIAVAFASKGVSRRLCVVSLVPFLAAIAVAALILVLGFYSG
jgi:hypothetical protein